MNKLRLYIFLFFAAVSLPLGLLIYQSYSGIQQEERGQLLFFAETLFDQMEAELATLIEREENRAVDEYQYFPGQVKSQAVDGSSISSMVGGKLSDFIIGYLQNNPDGTFQTPLVADMGAVQEEKREMVGQLKEANRIFNAKKISIAAVPSPPPETQVTKIGGVEDNAERKSKSFSERFLKKVSKSPSKSYLGKKKQRVEEISAEQAYNISNEGDLVKQSRFGQKGDESRIEVEDNVSKDGDSVTHRGSLMSTALEEKQDAKEETERFQVEVAPFQSVAINEDLVYIFRRIAIKNQIYRQGFLIEVQPFLRHLIATHFSDQPLAAFASLEIKRRDQGGRAHSIKTGANFSNPDVFAERTFPLPFNFLQASITVNGMPRSAARSSLNLTLGVLALFMFLGMLVIYKSVKTVVMVSERRSQFVSSVTHELKTPLTNIRMYIEMLQEGVAATPEREQDYLDILGSESTRLSGLINNVLDMAKLEKKQRHFNMQKGDLRELLMEVEIIMSEKIRKEGFALNIKAENVAPFHFDRDVLIQILMNLMENSIKFGKKSVKREITLAAISTSDDVHISVSDTGPGIPKRALKKVFDDFYRVDNDLTRTTGGTGIGLALVKKLAQAMGGKVTAQNNHEFGCTITICLPRVTG